MRWLAVPTPIGDLGVGVDETGLRRIDFADGPPPRSSRAARADQARAAGEDRAGADRANGDQGCEDRAAADIPGVAGLPAEVAQQLRDYFAGELTDFWVPMSVPSGSQFEREVWQAIASIPYAEMRTYGQIATDLGDREAARAVGVACNRNPLPIVVPCHRVVGAGGKLVGFGGGLPRKRFLLELEAKVRIQRDFT